MLIGGNERFNNILYIQWIWIEDEFLKGHFICRIAFPLLLPSFFIQTTISLYENLLILFNKKPHLYHIQALSMEKENNNLLNAIETVLWNSDEEIWLDFDIRTNKPRFKKYFKEKYIYLKV